MTKRSKCPFSRFGPSFPDLGWAPAPRYLLRRHLVLSDLAQRSPGRVVEIGPGIGALLHELTATGWSCTGVEASPKAFHLASDAARRTMSVTILPALSSDLRPFDCLMAFEVLEHIEDDVAALRSWLSHLRPGGRVLLSVPAHQRRWSASDVLAGHCRRYDRERFIRIAEKSGCDVESIVCYGWPLANVTSRVRAWRDHMRLEPTDVLAHSRERRDAYTFASGIERRTDVRIYPFIDNVFGATVLRLCTKLQSLTLRTEMGNGYLLAATKR